MVFAPLRNSARALLALRPRRVLWPSLIDSWPRTGSAGNRFVVGQRRPSHGGAPRKDDRVGIAQPSSPADEDGPRVFQDRRRRGRYPDADLRSQPLAGHTSRLEPATVVNQG